MNDIAWKSSDLFRMQLVGGRWLEIAAERSFQLLRLEGRHIQLETPMRLRRSV